MVGSHWRGLGLWNLYFISKLMLHWAGVLNFHVLYNLVFAAALLVPLPPLWLHRVRCSVATLAGVALLYYDSWLPPFKRLLAQPELLHFSSDYLLELAVRFINWDLVGAGFVLLVAYLFLAQWLRLTVFSVAALACTALASSFTLPSWLLVQPTSGMQPVYQVADVQHNPDTGVLSRTTQPIQGSPSNSQLTEKLDAFYLDEKTRQTSFPGANESAPFDILFINVCSLSNSDLEVSRLQDHALFKRMDVVFDQFNSATGYSGPAVLRLLRASCGQSSHSDLYKPAADQCYLFQNLQRLGFDTESVLNHNGQFQGFLDELTVQGRFPQPFIPTATRPKLTAFDGSPIWNDYDTLSQWWERRKQSGADRTALLYNTITLHDGNREATADGGGRSAPFTTRAQNLLDDLNVFIDDLERSGRKAVLVFVPEHGAALQGDRMQIAGMREIATLDITQIPVGLRVIGANRKATAQPVHVTSPSSYLALSELVSRLVGTNLFVDEGIDWPELTKNLPVTAAVSENDGTVLLQHNEVPYVRMGNRNWIEYPQ
ncbi:cellulose biosynthesis protein BcsG [Pollutimonas subterranea]|uniref:Cellulose biosynthesis protein BcsG n=2 Tax=Pollutimonas subterranea TaxID=2045210 RepID=A0A2N4U061_9BURK|nr:cellulose biosynthesis protein BcsG [Pollutimonas subterranea]